MLRWGCEEYIENLLPAFRYRKAKQKYTKKCPKPSLFRAFAGQKQGRKSEPHHGGKENDAKGRRQAANVMSPHSSPPCPSNRPKRLAQKRRDEGAFLFQIPLSKAFSLAQNQNKNSHSVLWHTACQKKTVDFRKRLQRSRSYHRACTKNAKLSVFLSIVAPLIEDGRRLF